MNPTSTEETQPACICLCPLLRPPLTSSDQSVFFAISLHYFYTRGALEIIWESRRNSCYVHSFTLTWVPSFYHMKAVDSEVAMIFPVSGTDAASESIVRDLLLTTLSGGNHEHKCQKHAKKQNAHLVKPAIQHKQRWRQP
eukprot:3656311-Rhodomonas_salina.3